MSSYPTNESTSRADEGEASFREGGKALRITVVAALLLYAGIVVSGLPYILLVTDRWIQSIAVLCSGRPDLCVEVSSEVRYVRGWWRGRVFFFVAQPGKSSQLKALFRESCPADFIDQIRSPCYYAGISVTEP